MMPQSPIRIVYVTDRGFVKPTLVSIWSLMETIGCEAELHLWGDGLTIDDWENVARVTAINPKVTLHRKNLGEGHLTGACGPKDYISAATMGRLFIPRYLDGPVLYVDGDTLVVNDISALFDIDLGTAYAGVVRDFTLLHWLADKKATSAQQEARRKEVTELLAPSPVTGYFNAGVMLFNCDRIRAEPEMLRRVEDVVLASQYSHGDQDHLNRLFRGNVQFLDIAWNLSWGRAKRHRCYFRDLELPQHELLPGKPRIIHYHGPEKPWKAPRRDIWSSRGRATASYRRSLARFSARFPDLRP